MKVKGRQPFPSRSAIVIAWVTTVGLFIVILIGFLDADTHSALGCGAMWPLCNGGVLPGPGMKSMIEYSHRAITGVVGILVAIMVVGAWRQAHDREEWKVLGGFGLGFVIVQAGIGAAAVLSAEPPPILALHLGFALLAFAGVALLTVALMQHRRELAGEESGYVLRQRHPAPPVLRRWIWGTIGLLYAVIYLGAYVAQTQAGWACAGWPLCNGRWIPTLHGLTLVIFAHRVAALVVVAVAVRLLGLVVPLRHERPDLYRGGLTVVGLVVALALSGAVVVWSGHTTGSDLLHVALVTSLFTAVSYLCLQAMPSLAGKGLGPAAGKTTHGEGSV